MRGDLLDTWRAQTPPDAPNRFIVNIQPEQREPLARVLRAQRRRQRRTTYPMVRGRLVALNGNAGRRGRYFDERASAGWSSASSTCSFMDAPAAPTTR